VPWLYSACGHCEYCLTGWETVCAEAQFGGFTKNGGFAEYILADPNYVARVPSGLAAKDAAPIICAALPPTRGSRRPQRNLANGSPSRALAASGIWRFNRVEAV
jgi:propanol-preferring alcohol dehydrogenase